MQEIPMPDTVGFEFKAGTLQWQVAWMRGTEHLATAFRTDEKARWVHIGTLLTDEYVVTSKSLGEARQKAAEFAESLGAEK